MNRHTAAIVAVLLGSLIGAAGAATACGGVTTTDIVRTSEAQNKVENATATAQAAATSIAKGETQRGGAGDVTGGQGGFAGSLRATAAAAATATAAAGGSQPATELTATPTPSAIDVLDPPPGDPVTGEVTVKVGNGGRYDPDVIKIKAGTKVTWENTERSAHQTVADPGQAEQWDSGTMLRPLGSNDNIKFSHTFTKTGRFTYTSLSATDLGVKGVVFVVP